MNKQPSLVELAVYGYDAMSTHVEKGSWVEQTFNNKTSGGEQNGHGYIRRSNKDQTECEEQ